MCIRKARFESTFFSKSPFHKDSPQKDAHKLADLENNKLFISHNDVYFSKKDDKFKDTYSYGSYKNVNIFCNYLKDRIRNNRKCCFFEQLEENTPVYECYDLDWDLELLTENDVLSLFFDIRSSFRKGPHLYSRDLRITTATRITDLDKSTFDPKSNKILDIDKVPVTSCLPMDSKNTIAAPGNIVVSKGSLHIVVKSRYAFKNVVHLGSFMDVFRLYWEHMVGGNEQLVNVIDWGIYTKNRQMRTVYSCKQMSNRPLLPYRGHGYSRDAPVEDFFITGVSPGVQIIEDFIPVISRSFKGPTLNSIGIIEEDIREIVAEVLDGAFAYTIADTYVSLRRIKPSMCPTCGRIHERESAFISITRTGQYKFCCFRDMKKKKRIGTAKDYSKIPNFDAPRLCPTLTSI